MKLRLKEDPREWRKFGLVMACAMALLGGWLRYRNLWEDTTLALWLATWMAALIAGWLRPRWIRPVYRAAMTASHHVGQVMGRVLLTIIYFLVLAPLGLILRLSGKDLLQLRREPGRESYWEKARPSTPLDRLY